MVTAMTTTTTATTTATTATTATATMRALWRDDRALEMDARAHVESILHQMAEGESGGDCHDSSSSSAAAGGAGGGDLSVSGLVFVLVARFNS
jgi:hypothetical protein